MNSQRIDPGRDGSRVRRQPLETGSGKPYSSSPSTYHHDRGDRQN
ncbi:hypothetical protein [Oxynema aestuarii]|nr:hypothetical protein [Oxynema aestuarii]